MLSALLDPETRMPRTQMFWVVLGGLIVVQLLALWLLCSHQVRLAEARDTENQVLRMALTDCLQYIPGSTIASCTNRIMQTTDRTTSAMGAAPARTAGAMPVGFVRSMR
ncbi:MAG TPA: hypothetical protein VFH35_07460 [Ramlibacter sp.]|nr:hypothetical protein [Ramlibacter sp.]